MPTKRSMYKSKYVLLSLFVVRVAAPISGTLNTAGGREKGLSAIVATPLLQRREELRRIDVERIRQADERLECRVRLGGFDLLKVPQVQLGGSGCPLLGEPVRLA